MATKPKTTTESKEVTIIPVSEGQIVLHLVGLSPLIKNRMSEKAKRSLLLPSGRMNEAERAANLKHDPVREFRDSVYRNPGETPATRLKLPAAMFKGAMMSAALDMPGARKTEIGRLVSIKGFNFDLYGVPRLFMSVVRNAGIERVPDIRTRAIVEKWACRVVIGFLQPKLTPKTVYTLLAAGGLICGVGDWRQEKGSGNFGRFRIVDPDDAEYRQIIATGGREVQDAALQNYECYDDDTQELLDWYLTEVVHRGRESQVAPDNAAMPSPAAISRRKSNSGNGAHANGSA